MSCLVRFAGRTITVSTLVRVFFMAVSAASAASAALISIAALTALTCLLIRSATTRRTLKKTFNTLK